MKKIVLLFFLVLFMANFAFARDEDFGFKGPLNYFQSKILERVISTQVQKVVGGKVQTQVSSYGAKALRQGVFKSAKISGEDLQFDGLTLSGFVAETVTENNRIDISDKKSPKLLTDVRGEYKATLTNDDIQKVLNSSVCRKEISKINKKLAPFAEISDVEMFCQTNRLHLKLNMVSGLFGTSFAVSASTGIYSDAGWAELQDVKFSKKMKLGLSDSVIAVLNDLNPINLVIKELDNAKLDISVNEIKIVDDKIEIFGIINVYRGV